MLEINNLTITSSDKTLVNNISFSVAKNEIFALVGESGSGKTLTALSVLGLLANSLSITGDINYNGQKISKKNIKNIRGKKIAFIFQDSDSAINPVFRVGNQLQELYLINNKLSKKNIRQEINKTLNLVGLDNNCYYKYVHELSGGQKQRIMIAMVLLSGAELLIADEPTTALDVSTQRQILDLLIKLNKLKNLTILIITHDLMLVKLIADRVGVMRNGNLLTIKDNDDFFDNCYDEYTKELLIKLEKKLDTTTIDTNPIIKTINLAKKFPIKSNGIFRITKSYQQVLDNINLVLNKGTNLAIVGESGSGKTTLANTIIKQLKQSYGSIFFQDTNIDKINNIIYASKVQIIFQNVFGSFNPKKTLLNTLLDAMSALNIQHQDNTQYLCVLFNEVGLDCNLINSYPSQLSGGQLQRVAIIRALSVSPDVIICDEPSSALDNTIKKQILDLLLKLQQKHHISYILITHDISVVRYFSDDIVVLKAGLIVEQGKTSLVIANPKHKYTKMLLDSVLM